MRVFERGGDLAPHVGETIGSSDWVEVTQEMIDLFAQATGDRQWIHVDVERAAREMPGGKTIAHGYLTLSLLPRLSGQVFRIAQQSRSLNYGSNKVRFLAPVTSGSRIRVTQVLGTLEPVAGGNRLIIESTIEIEGRDKPALIAETIRLTYD